MASDCSTELDYEDDLSLGEGSTQVDDSSGKEDLSPIPMEGRLVHRSPQVLSVPSPLVGNEPTMDAVQRAHVGSQCPLCPNSFKKLKRHILYSHLPWYWAGSTACFSCKVQCFDLSCLNKFHNLCPRDPTNNAQWAAKIHACLLFLVNHSPATNLQQLLDLIITLKMYPSPNYYNSPFTPTEQKWMQVYDLLHTSDPDPSRIFSTSPPNRVVCLTHWRIVASILAQLPPELQEYFSNI